MKNFFGRILILVTSIINVVLLLLNLASVLVFSFSSDGLVYLINNNLLTPLPIAGICVFLIAYITFVIINIICLVDISKGQSMKHSFVGAIISFILLLTSTILLILGINLQNGTFAFLMSTLVGMTIMNLFLIIGSGFNYYKDCR